MRNVQNPLQWLVVLDNGGRLKGGQACIVYICCMRCKCEGPMRCAVRSHRQDLLHCLRPRLDAGHGHTVCKVAGPCQPFTWQHHSTWMFLYRLESVQYVFNRQRWACMDYCHLCHINRFMYGLHDDVTIVAVYGPLTWFVRVRFRHHRSVGVPLPVC